MKLLKCAPFRTFALAIIIIAGIVPLCVYGGNGGPFEIGLHANVTTRIASATLLSDSDSKPDASGGPAIASASLSTVNESDHVGFASADFTEFKNRALISGTVTNASLAISDADAFDTLTISVPGSPTGTTRLEMIWQIEGFLSGDASYHLQSKHNLDSASSFLGIFAGSFSFKTPDDSGVISTPVTFVYENVPLNAPWNWEMFADAAAPRNGFDGGIGGPGEADFDNTTTLTSVQLFINNSPVPSQVTGASGAVYLVPEPASLTLLVGTWVMLLLARQSYSS